MQKLKKKKKKKKKKNKNKKKKGRANVDGKKDALLHALVVHNLKYLMRESLRY